MQTYDIKTICGIYFDKNQIAKEKDNVKYVDESGKDAIGYEVTFKNGCKYIINKERSNTNVGKAYITASTDDEGNNVVKLNNVTGGCIFGVKGEKDNIELSGTDSVSLYLKDDSNDNDSVTHKSYHNSKNTYLHCDAGDCIFGSMQKKAFDGKIN